MKSNHQKIDHLVNDLAKIRKVEFIMLGGSHSTGDQSKDSDFDLYIYSQKFIPIKKREKILTKHCAVVKLNHQFFETEDSCILEDSNTLVELVYRDIKWITNQLHSLLKEHKASVGYTTCFWHNFINSQILYDKTGRGKSLQSKYSTSFPKQLKQNIIQKNYPLLKSTSCSYHHQIKQAIKRKDIVSLNHRTAAFLASYFDILFALNQMPHPGEKRILTHLKQSATHLPQNIFRDVPTLIQLSTKPNPDILSQIDQMIEQLDQCLSQLNLLKYAKT